MHPFVRFLGFCLLMMLVGLGTFFIVMAATADIGRGIIAGAGTFLLTGRAFVSRDALKLKRDSDAYGLIHQVNPDNFLMLRCKCRRFAIAKTLVDSSA